MSIVDLLIERNAAFAAERFSPDLSINPSRQLMVIGCVDPRVDPSRVLGVELGEAGMIRNVGGRITPATLRTMGMLSKVGQANGGAPTGGWNLVVLHHTDCGMTDLAAFPDLLAEYFEVPVEALEAKAVSDPYASVRADVALLRHTQPLASTFQVTGLVYDVDTGLVELTVPPTPPSGG